MNWLNLKQNRPCEGWGGLVCPVAIIGLQQRARQIIFPILASFPSIVCDVLSSKSDVYNQRRFNINAIFVKRGQSVMRPILTILYGPYNMIHINFEGVRLGTHSV